MTADPPQLLEPGEGETIRPGLEIKIGRPELVMTETVLGAGEVGVSPHVHHHHADAFYVIEGTLVLVLDGEELVLEAGGFALVPPDVVHSFRIAASGPARYLNIHAPGMGFDEYLRSGFCADFDQHEPPGGGGRPASEVIVRAPGEGRPLALGDSSATIKAGTDDVLGSFALMELDLAPGFPGSVLHRHERMTDSFYVLEGELGLQLGETSMSAPGGSYAFVPPSNSHTFSGAKGERVRALNLMAPAGLERYLEEVAALGASDPRRMAEIASKYDFSVIQAP
jgi:mannose-6-phosphate isomerase-like protein (cupin superfamily)